MFATVLLAVLASAPSPSAAVAPQDPTIRITLNNDRQFVRGDQAKVKIRTNDDGYLLVLHADPDGRIRVLFPLDPTDDNFIRGHRSYELRDRGDRESFSINASSGQGAIYAAVSRSPFEFSAFSVNNHWDYNRLNTQDPGTDPEPVLGDLVQQMATSQYDYDYLTYDVYDNTYASVSYAAPATVYSPAYAYGASYYCDPVYDFYCDPYYYSPSRFSVAVSFGSPWYYRPYYYDPFYSGYYSPYFYNRPARYYGYYRPYYYAPGGGLAYRPRYTTPSQFKQADRTWDGATYRDRLGGNPVRSVNTLYNPAPVRRGTTTGDMGRPPAASPSTTTASPRRRVEARPAQVDRAPAERAAPARRESPPAERAAPAQREAPPATRAEPRRREAPPANPAPRAEPRVSSPPAREATPARRRGNDSQVRSAPELQRRNAPSDSPRMTEPAIRGIPARQFTERRAPEMRAAPARRAEPSFRSAPAARSYSPSAARAPRSEPARSYSAPAARAPRSEPARSSGGGGRRGPR